VYTCTFLRSLILKAAGEDADEEEKGPVNWQPKGI